MSCCANPSKYYLKGKWICETCHDETPDDYKEYQPGVNLYTPKSNKKCECGAESTPNSNCHTHWCPKYQK